MGGLGSRFSNAGYKTPKPLIMVDGVPMFKKSLSSLDSIKAHKDYFFVIRKEDIEKYSLDNMILNHEPKSKIIVLDKNTKGASETAYKAKKNLNPEDGLLIIDCDLWFSSTEYTNTVIKSLNGKLDIDGALLTFNSTNSRYSYALTDDSNIVQKTAEKIVISKKAITGAYYFSKAQYFTIACEELFKTPLDDEIREYYISSLYNILVSKGYKILATKVDKQAHFGTPDELNHYLKDGLV